MGDGVDCYQGVEEAYEAADLEMQEEKEYREEHMEAAYRRAKAAPAGSTVECPVCRLPFKKRTSPQAFCSNKGRGNCKDSYWNTVDEDRRVRARHFNR